MRYLRNRNTEASDEEPFRFLSESDSDSETLSEYYEQHSESEYSTHSDTSNSIHENISDDEYGNEYQFPSKIKTSSIDIHLQSYCNDDESHSSPIALKMDKHNNVLLDNETDVRPKNIPTNTHQDSSQICCDTEWWISTDYFGNDDDCEIDWIYDDSFIDYGVLV